MSRMAFSSCFHLVLRLNSERITTVDMDTISLKLPEHLLELLEEKARARHTTKSAVVRECLEKALARGASGAGASCYDLAHDLAGSVKGLPRDLATNPKHMESFGPMAARSFPC